MPKVTASPLLNSRITLNQFPVFLSDTWRGKERAVVKHRTRENCRRWLTLNEIRKLHRLPPGYQLSDDSKILSGEVIGQGVIVSLFQKIILFGLEPLTQDLEGYVYYKQFRVEHYSFSSDPGLTERLRQDAIQLVRACRQLEEMNITPSISAVLSLPSEQVIH